MNAVRFWVEFFPEPMLQPLSPSEENKNRLTRDKLQVAHRASLAR